MAGETRDDGSDDVPRRSISIEPEKWWKNAQSRGERREEGEEWKKEKKEEIGGGGPIKRGRERRRMNGRAVWNLGNAHSLLFSFFPLSFFFLFPPPPPPGRQSRLTGFLTSVGNIFGVIIAWFSDSPYSQLLWMIRRMKESDERRGDWKNVSCDLWSMVNWSTIKRYDLLIIRCSAFVLRLLRRIYI